MPIQLAGCILLDEHKRILLIHRQTNDYDHWEVPGGKLEPNETAQQAAIRELAEELGIKVSLERKLGETKFTDKSQEFHYTWFLANSNEKPTVKEPHIFTEARYFKSEDLASNSIPLSVGAKCFGELLRRGKITL